jgi:predicted permease
MFNLRALFRKHHAEQEMDDELRFHLEKQIEQNLARGMSVEQARYAALRTFGNVSQLKEECRDSWGVRLISELAQDLRYGLRQLRRNPGFTIVAVLTLALGIGANTAIFSLIDAVLLRSLPVNSPSHLVLFQWTARNPPHETDSSNFGDCNGYIGRASSGSSGCNFSLPFFEMVKSQSALFSGVTAFAGPAQVVLSDNGPARNVHVEIVSGDYFSTLGVKPAIGRTLGPGDDTPRSSSAVVLSYAFWQNAFGGDRSIPGRTVLLNSVPFTIAGVAEQSFTNLAPGKVQDLFLPIAMAPRLNISWANKGRTLGNWWLVVLGRLKPGVTMAEAQAVSSLLFRNTMLHSDKPLSKPSDDPKIILAPAQQGLTGLQGYFSKPLYVLMCAVGLILLIACANVAGLLLSRASARQKEMAVRLAVGAGRTRLLRQLLAESMLMSMAGGVLGVMFAYWGVRAITSLISTSLPGGFPFEIGPDWRVLAFTISISLFAAILFGLVPAFRSIRVDLTPALKENPATFPLREILADRNFHPGKVLVVVQVALSMVVLVGAALLVRTLYNLRRVNPGFETSNLLLFGIDPTAENLKDSQTRTLYDELRDRLAAIPGVISASYSFPALLSGSLSMTGFHIEGRPANVNISVDDVAIGSKFLSTIGIPLLEGRAFNRADFLQAAEAMAALHEWREETAKAKLSKPATAEAAPPIPVLVNQAFAREYFPRGTPLGARLTEEKDPTSLEEEAQGKPRLAREIVGIVGDTKYNNLRREIHPTVYIPMTGGSAYFELRTSTVPTALVPTVRQLVQHMDKHLPIYKVQSQMESIDNLLIEERLVARLSGLFGALAMLLACIGLYGLVSYDAARRRREIGIRMALGAERRDVLKMVVGQGFKLVLIGLVIGVAGALALTRFLASLLYGVEPTDPFTFIVASLILLAVALLACYIPARRAANIDPTVALRYE